MKVTMETIACKLGVSRNTVSLALRNHPSIPESTRRRVRDAAEESGYRRNPAHGELMSQMRLKGHGSTLAALALFNANPDPKAFEHHPTIPTYVAGCRRRASELGYPLNRFWLHEPGMDSGRWIQVLETRGIRGLILIGFMNRNRIPEAFLPVVDKFPAVVTGVRTRDPALSFSCVDHHILTLRAVEKSLEMGYRRPGLVLDGEIDALVEHRFSSGYVCGQARLPRSRRLRPFYDLQEAQNKPEIFRKWFASQKPDVIFTLYNVVKTWVQDLGLRVPDDVGMIQLEWREQEPDWAGMNQHNDITGEAAVDMLIGMIHRGESSVSDFPRATLIGPSWMDGPTVRNTERRSP